MSWFSTLQRKGMVEFINATDAGGQRKDSKMREGRYDIKETHYRDIYGKLLWTEPMIFSRLYAVGQEFIENSQTYTVARVAVADNVQHVNIRKR